MPDLTVKVRAVEKLLDYAASGVGAIAGPMLANWKAAKEGRARLTSARFDADVRRVEAESNAQSLVIIAEAQAKARNSIDAVPGSATGMGNITREDITQSIEFQGRKRLANVASVIEDTANQLGEKEISNHEPDPDWTARFFDCVQDVSSDDKRKIWARILAGEVESPGRTSLRTLETLRNMTKRDAVMFRDFCDFVIDDKFVFYGELSKDLEALNYSKLLHLQDCGLISLGPNLVTRYKLVEHNYTTLKHHSGVLLITREQEADEDLTIPAARLTSIGIELSLVVDGKTKMEYLQRVSGFLKSRYCQLTLLPDATFGSDGVISYLSKVPVDPKL